MVRVWVWNFNCGSYSMTHDRPSYFVTVVIWSHSGHGNHPQLVTLTRRACGRGVLSPSSNVWTIRRCRLAVRTVPMTRTSRGPLSIEPAAKRPVSCRHRDEQWRRLYLGQNYCLDWALNLNLGGLITIGVRANFSKGRGGWYVFARN